MNKSKGIIYALSSSAAFGIMPILAKTAYNYNANCLTVVNLRFFFAWMILLPIILIKKKSLKLDKKQLFNLLLIGIFTYASTTLTLFLSYNYISVGLATTIHFIYPIAVTLISIIVFRERIFKEKVLALLVSTLGVYMLVYNGDIKLNFLGVFFAIFSGILYSLYIVSIDHSNLRQVDSFVLTFYLSLISFATLFIGGLSTKSINLNIDIRCYIACFFIALISTALAVTLFQKGIKIIGASNASILSTFEPIVSMILGVIILKEAITFKIVIGGLLILSSVVLLTKSYAKQNKGEV